MAMTRRPWSISALAVEFQLDRRTISARIGDIPRSTDDGWYLADVAAAIVGADRARAGDFDLEAERARLAKEQADALEMKNATTRGELLPASEVHVAMTGAFTRVRAKLLSIPAKVAPLVFGVKTVAEAKQTMAVAINEALAELAATQIAGVPNEGSDAS